MDQKTLNDVSQRIREVLAQSPAADLDKNLRTMLTGLFARLDLVTREEFDVQRQVLLRTREQLSRLESEIGALERKVAAAPAQTPPQPPDRGDAPTGV